MSTSKYQTFDRAAVASEQKTASMAGVEVLRRGGNAFDAAVATSFSLAVTLHPAGGLGGDFFGMFYEARTGKVHCLNGSGWSPSGLTRDLLQAKGEGRVLQDGPSSCVIPGFVAGVWEMHRKFGNSEIGGLLRPAYEMAKGGFKATPGFCRDVAGAYADLPVLAKKVFAPEGRPPSPGEEIKQEALGKVIFDLAEGGPDYFYGGMPAQKMAERLASLGVPCTLDDFSSFRPEWVSPLSLEYGGTTVFETPPNSMGATTLLMLKLLGDSLSKTGPLSKERVESTMKAALTAYARRDRMLGDPRTNSIDMEAFMSDATSEEVPKTIPRPGDTTAFSVVDAEGNVVSAIQSLFSRFGSRVFIEECGIVLNNRASGFSMDGQNGVGPRKRPLHTLSSMILVKGGEPRLAIGASGGDYRPMQHALFVSNFVDYGMHADHVIGHPRFLWGGGRRLLVEEGYEIPPGGEYEIQNLPMPGRTGVAHGVELGEGLKAVCDIRGDGLPAGF